MPDARINTGWPVELLCRSDSPHRMHWKAAWQGNALASMSRWQKDAEIQRHGEDLYFRSVVKSRRVRPLDGSNAHFSGMSA